MTTEAFLGVVVPSAGRGSPDPADDLTAGLPCVLETYGQRLWHGRETGHNIM